MVLLKSSLGFGVLPRPAILLYTLFQTIKGNVLNVIPKIMVVIQPKKIVNPYNCTSCKLFTVASIIMMATKTSTGTIVKANDSIELFSYSSTFLRIRSAKDRYI